MPCAPPTSVVQPWDARGNASACKCGIAVGQMTIFMTWLAKTLTYPPSTIDVMAHHRYAEEVDDATATLGAGHVATAQDDVLMLQCPH